MGLEEYSLETLYKERQVALERSAELHGRSTNIIQNMVVIIGSGALAATQEPGAFVIAPIMWSVWVLYAQQIDRDTIKWNMYCDWLGDKHDAYLDEVGGRRVNSPRAELFAVQGGKVERLLYLFPAIYMFVIQVLLCAIALYLLWHDSKHTEAVSFGLWMVLVITIFTLVAMRREKIVEQYRQVLDKYR